MPRIAPGLENPGGTQTAPPPMRREIELDFLRGIAILSVLDGHDFIPVLAWPFLKLGFPHFGWVGVDLFFVLSGFLVGGLLVKEWREQGRIDSRRFLVRRGFKIWPQYYVFISLIVLTGHRPLQEIWACFVHLQNYFIEVPHLWTLAVEEHAYLLLVIGLSIAAWCRARTSTLLWVIGGTCAGVVILRLVLAVLGQPFIFVTHTRVEGILYGVLLALVFHGRPDVFRRMQSWRWLWIGSLGLVLAYFRLNLPQNWALSVTFDMANLLGVSLLMLLYHHDPHKVRPWLYRLVAWIGLYSYGIYLWHVSPSSAVFKIGDRLPPAVSHLWVAVAQPLAGIALGVVMTKLVEFPMLRLREHWFPRRVVSPVEVSPAEWKTAT